MENRLISFFVAHTTHTKKCSPLFCSRTTRARALLSSSTVRRRLNRAEWTLPPPLLTPVWHIKKREGKVSPSFSLPAAKPSGPRMQRVVVVDLVETKFDFWTEFCEFSECNFVVCFCSLLSNRSSVLGWLFFFHQQAAERRKKDGSRASFSLPSSSSSHWCYLFFGYVGVGGEGGSGKCWTGAFTLCSSTNGTFLTLLSFMPSIKKAFVKARTPLKFKKVLTLVVKRGP